MKNILLVGFLLFLCSCHFNNQTKNSKENLDINNHSIFLMRDSTKDHVKNISSLKFKNIIINDDFYVPAMLYEPESIKSRNIMLYFHGGGWTKGSIESHDCLCRKLANALNIRVVSVEYRLAPKYQFPIAVTDALSVYCGLFDNQYLNFDNVIISGDSAGGNLCASLCIKLREIGYKKMPISQILFYPVLTNNFTSKSYQRFGNKENLTKSMMECFIYTYTGKYHDDKEIADNKLIYPLLENDMSVFPRTLIVSAKDDVLFDEQVAFVSKLQKGGIEVKQLIVKANHGFMTYGKNHWKLVPAVLDKIRNYLSPYS